MKLKLKKKEIVVEERKPIPEGASVPVPLFNEFAYAKVARSNARDIASLVRENYEQLFGEFPPWDIQTFTMLILKIEYELLYRDFQNAGRELPPKPKQNYLASKEFDIEGLTPDLSCFTKSAIKVELKKGGTDVVKKQMEKKKKVKKEEVKTKVKSRTNESASESFERMFKLRGQKVMDDKQVAEEMRKLHPNRKAYDEKYVAGVRKKFERLGTLLGGSTKPEKKVKEKKTKAKEVVKKPKAVLKKMVLKIKRKEQTF